MKRRWILFLAMVGGIAGSGLIESFNSMTVAAPSLNCQQAQTQTEMNQCADRRAKDADRRLNQVYKQLRNKQEAELNALLLKAQENWIKYRDASCAYSVQPVAGGSTAPMVHSECITQLTKQRIEVLEWYLTKGHL